MKKYLILFLPALSCFFVTAQNIENADFDSVYIGGIDRIHNWITSDSWNINSGDTAMPLEPFTHYTSVGLDFHMAYNTVLLDYSTAYAGYSAILCAIPGVVTSQGEPFPGFVINGDHFYTGSSGYPDLARCGMPFPFRPVSIKGYYKFEDSVSNPPKRGKAVILLKKYNELTGESDTIAYVSDTLVLAVQANWTTFEIPLNYQDISMPDSIVVAFFALSSGTGQARLWIDELGFKYNSQVLPEQGISCRPVFYPGRSGGGVLFISAPSAASVDIWDLAGKLIIKRNVPDNGIIPVDWLSSGCYITVVQYRDGTVYRQKFIKNK